jgi:hypothetical protein
MDTMEGNIYIMRVTRCEVVRVGYASGCKGWVCKRLKSGIIGDYIEWELVR